MHAVATLRANFSKSLLVGIPPLPSTGVAAPLDLGGAASRLHRQLAGAMSEGLSQIPGVRGWDLDLVERNVGSASAVDFRQWYLYRQPFSEVFLLAAATLLGRLIAAPRRAPRKCVVVDGDNTLWGGIVGEDGAAGVQIGEEFPGSAYRDFQRLLLHWRAQGVLLALASKNNEADVWELFQSRPDMPITRDDFAAHRINWETKPENLASLARELNLGLESFVFIDDSPIEIDFVRRALPQVLCILLPDEPAEILPRLRSLTCFDRFEVTTEDRSRAEMMLAERQRQAATGTLSKEEFQRSLDLRVRLFPAAEEDLERIAQLINKTNQFNLSARRRTVDEVRALFCATTHRIYGVQVADRFGSYGLTGVVILEAAAAAHGPGWSVDTFLLSCRVLGRGVEGAILAALAEEATAGGVVEIAAIYLPNGKNAQAAAFLPESGFALDDGGVWRLDPAAVPSLAPFITVTRAREA